MKKILSEKMKRNIFLFLLVVGLLVQTVWAHPPETNLSYDAKAKMLHIEIKHVSSNLNNHRIREVEILKNDKTINHLYFARQPTPTGLTQDVPLEAVKGDRIRVRVISAKTGPKEETLTIP